MFNHDARRQRHILQIDRIADLHVGDVDRQLLGDLCRQTLDLHLPNDVFQRPAFLLDTYGFSNGFYGHRNSDLLRQGYLVKIHMKDIAGDRVILDLLDQYRPLFVFFAAGDLQGDHHVFAAVMRMHEFDQTAALDLQGQCLFALPVNNARHKPSAAQDVVFANLRVFPHLRFQINRFHCRDLLNFAYN